MKKMILFYLLVFLIIIGIFLFKTLNKVFATDLSETQLVATDDMLLWYKLNESSGTIAEDSSGNGNAGILKGGASWVHGIGGNCLKLDGIDGHLIMPDNILQDIDDITISSFMKLDSSATPPQWLATFSNTSNGYIYFSPNLGNEFRYAITHTNWSGESKVRSTAIDTNMWSNVTVTYSSKKNIATLYLDGKIVSESDVTIKPSDLEPTNANFIGKPWPGYSDHYFNGCVSDFRLYKRVLSDFEIENISNSMSNEIVKMDKDALDLGDLSQVTEEIDLPTKGANGTSISWAASDENTISSSGVVIRPTSSVGDKKVTLTATITKGIISDTKVFNVVVIALLENEDQEISIAKNRLEIPNADNVRGNITLPNTMMVGKEIVKIIWKVDKKEVVNVNEEINADYDITPAGVVTRQSLDTKVSLKATLYHGKMVGTKIFKIIVKAKPISLSESDYNGYFFVYFNGTSRDDAEQIYFASSEDGLHWDELNENNPVLSSTLGDKGVRDPFILRSPEGDKFYMVATDLRIANGAGWNAAQTNGSKSIIVWESTDLVNWSKERQVNIARDDAGCTWAPEIVYDDKTGEYLVFWASKVAEDDYAKHRIYISKTRDFYTFTKPEVYIDRSDDVIDTTIIKHDGMYYRFSKDEVNKNIIIDKSDQLLHKEFEMIPAATVSSQSGVEGPSIFKFNGENKWCLLLDNYGGGGYYPLISKDIDSGEFTKLKRSEYSLPYGSHHGSVMRITKSEYKAIMSKWSQEVVKPEEDPQKTPVLEYKFDEISNDSIILDTSGNEYTGNLNGNATYIEDQEKKSQVLYLDGTKNTFAELPQGFFEGRDNVTISMDVKPETISGNFFTFGIGKNRNKYMFLKTMDTQIRNAITINSYHSEQDVKASTDSNKSKWMNIKIVIKPTSMAIYKDGRLLSENSNVTLSMSDLGTDLLTYLGKSFYSEDEYFKGYFDNLKVYNYSLTELEIAKKHGINDVAIVKNATAENYSIIKTAVDEKRKYVKVYFSRNNSTKNDLKQVPLFLELSEGCTIDGINGEKVDLSKKPIHLMINVPGQAKQQWTVKGIFCNNQVIGGEFADPDIDVFDGKYYIYPTTDGFTGWSGTQFHVFSSDDLINWTDGGVVLDVAKGNDIPWSIGSAWAPTIEKKDGKYYFYFCAKRSDGKSCIGVATSKSPTGPFIAEKNPLITPEIVFKESATVGQTIDPSIFTNSDGTSYMLFGNGKALAVELNPDMVSIKTGTMKNISGAYDFREAITVTKKDEIYHFTWSCDDTGSENYHINYGTSKSLYGPIEYKYTILSKDTSNDILGTGHHSILKIPKKDEYYIAYHRFVTPIGQYQNGFGYHREICIDKLKFDKKSGLMKVVTPTLKGLTKPVKIKKHEKWYWIREYFKDMLKKFMK
ncbi:MAG: family 43 glycosylhydrolase [Clostridiales bacterium]